MTPDERSDCIIRVFEDAQELFAKAVQDEDWKAEGYPSLEEWARVTVGPNIRWFSRFLPK